MPTKMNAFLCAFLTDKSQKVTLFCLNKLAIYRQNGRFMGFLNEAEAAQCAASASFVFFIFIYIWRMTSVATRAILSAGARNTHAFLQSAGM
jgi:uncharacterized membrane protein